MKYKIQMIVATGCIEWEHEFNAFLDDEAINRTILLLKNDRAFRSAFGARIYNEKNELVKSVTLERHIQVKETV